MHEESKKAPFPKIKSWFLKGWYFNRLHVHLFSVLESYLANSIIGIQVFGSMVPERFSELNLS